MELFRHSLYFFLSMLALAGITFLFVRLDKGRHILAERILGKAAARLPEGVAMRRTLRRICAIAALFFLIAAACVPQWGVELAPVTDLRGSIIVAVDVSLSMAAKDLKPTRLEHARMLLNDISDKFAEYRMGIVAFAGKAYTQCPLTDDSEAIKYFSSQLKPGMLPMQGTNFSSAIMQTLAMTEHQNGTKVLVLITDGEDHSKEIDMALKEAQAADLRIFPVGMGSPEGELVPMTDSMGNALGYKKDRSGKPVVSRLGENLLMRIAAATGSAYIRYVSPNTAADSLLNSINRLSLEKTRGKARAAFKNRYQWPLSLAFLFLLVELLLMDKKLFSGFSFKKTGKAMSVMAAVCLSLLLCQNVSAESAKSVARDGNALFSKGKYKEAAEQYEKAIGLSPEDKRMQYNLGVAQYKSGEFDKAKETFEGVEDEKQIAAKSYFNKGNALYKAKDIPGAVSAWKQVLRIDPSNKEAKFNLQKALSENDPKQCNNPDKKDNKNDKGNNKNQKDGNNGDNGNSGNNGNKDTNNPGNDDGKNQGDQDKKNDNKSKSQNPGKNDDDKQKSDEGKPKDKGNQDGDKEDDKNNNGKGKEDDKGTPKKGDKDKDKGGENPGNDVDGKKDSDKGNPKKGDKEKDKNNPSENPGNDIEGKIKSEKGEKERAARERKERQEREQAEQLLQMMAEKEKSDADKQQIEVRKVHARHQQPMQPEEDW